MSTERKPGSRGVMDRSAGAPAKVTPPIAADPGASQNAKQKASTKTVSPRKGFKKRK